MVLTSNPNKPNILYLCCKSKVIIYSYMQPKVVNMSQKSPYILKKIYPVELKLKNGNGESLTHREIDIVAIKVAGIVRENTIARYLHISDKTVSAHMNSIRNKLQISTDKIIELVSALNKRSIFLDHYQNVMLEYEFLNSLKKIKKIVGVSKIECDLLWEESRENKKNFLNGCTSYLKLAGVNSKLIVSYSSDEDICVQIKFRVQDNRDLMKVDLSTLEDLNNNKEVILHKVVSLKLQESYYHFLFKIIDQIYRNEEIKITQDNFYKKYEDFKNGVNIVPFSEGIIQSPSEPVARNSYQFVKFVLLRTLKKPYFFIGAICLVIIIISTIVYKYRAEYQAKSLVHYELILPKESMLLKREILIKQIDDKFREDKEDIKIIALLGAGGAGKTTIAHLYAKTQQGKSKIVWHINAETPENIKESFDNLAKALIVSDESMKVQRDLKTILNLNGEEDRLISFIKLQLKNNQNWVLIYDNVNNLEEIQKYIPQDSNLCGKGKIIITTRNGNVSNSKRINQVIKVGELSEYEKLRLFMKIMNDKPLSTPIVKSFLYNIAPLPLDVSISAFYLKTTNISFKQYLDNIERNDLGFNNVQVSLLKESGDYTQTRYNIITLSIEELFKSNKDFVDLFFIICLIDSDSIPRALLERFKDATIVDDFIHGLKQYSLITFEENLDSKRTFSIHRDTQNISLSYFKRKYSEKSKKQFCDLYPEILAKYVTVITDYEDIQSIQNFEKHLTKFLSHSDLLTKTSQNTIKAALGEIHYYLFNNKQAMNFLRESLTDLSDKDNVLYARALMHLGMVNNRNGDYNEAKKLLEQAIKIYSEHPLKTNENARALAYLGYIHRNLKNYSQAEEYIINSLSIYESIKNQDHLIGKAKTLRYQAIIAYDLGGYEKSIKLLNECLEIYSQYSNSEEYEGYSKALVQLALANISLGNYYKAENLLDKAINIYSKYSSENNENFIQAQVIQGTLQLSLGNFNKARDLLESSIKIYKNNHNLQSDLDKQRNLDIYYIRALVYLSTIYKHLNDLEAAQELFDYAMVLYKNKYKDNINIILPQLDIMLLIQNQHNQIDLLLQSSLRYCRNIYGENHIETARASRNLAQSLILNDDFDEAHKLLKHSLAVLSNKQHIEKYHSLELLGDLYYKNASKKRFLYNKEKIRELNLLASDNYKKALEIIRTNFPTHSIHFKRIMKKLEKAEGSGSLNHLINSLH